MQQSVQAKHAILEAQDRPHQSDCHKDLASQQPARSDEMPAKTLHIAPRRERAGFPACTAFVDSRDCDGRSVLTLHGGDVKSTGTRRCTSLSCFSAYGTRSICPRTIRLHSRYSLTRYQALSSLGARGSLDVTRPDFNKTVYNKAMKPAIRPPGSRLSGQSRNAKLDRGCENVTYASRPCLAP